MVFADVTFFTILPLSGFIFNIFILTSYIFIYHQTIDISTLNVHRSNFLVNTHSPFVFGSCLLLSIHYSLLCLRHSLLSDPCLLLFDRCSLFFLAVHYIICFLEVSVRVFTSLGYFTKNYNRCFGAGSCMFKASDNI